MKRSLLLIIFCCILTGCVKPLPPLYDYRLKTFVSGYRCFGGLSISKNGDYILVFNDNSIESVTLLEDDCLTHNSEYHEKLKELAILHNDELDDYQYYSKLGTFFEPPRIFLYPDFSSIHVEGDIDGTNVSLDDVTTVYSVSCKKHIDSRYKDTFDWPGFFSSDKDADIYRILFGIPNQGFEYLFPVKGLASDMDLDDLTLLGRDQSKDIPENEDGKAYPFIVLKINRENVTNVSITLQGSDGKQYSGHRDLEWSTGGL